jgi:hypothetical protein
MRHPLECVRGIAMIVDHLHIMAPNYFLLHRKLCFVVGVLQLVTVFICFTVVNRKAANRKRTAQLIDSLITRAGKITSYTGSSRLRTRQ